jgi:phospholipid:diacylglycerol acyltransferase
MVAMPYDWRLGFGDNEARDAYFSRLASNIEMLSNRLGQPAVIVAHSMGALLILHFLKHAEETPGLGNAWIERHVASIVTVGPPWSGVPKAASSVLSGEFRDTADLGGITLLLKERFVCVAHVFF